MYVCLYVCMNVCMHTIHIIYIRSYVLLLHIYIFVRLDVAPSKPTWQLGERTTPSGKGAKLLIMTAVEWRVVEHEEGDAHYDDRTS